MVQVAQTTFRVAFGNDRIVVSTPVAPRVRQAASLDHTLSKGVDLRCLRI